jgi:predicted ABC-type ATPase
MVHDGEGKPRIYVIAGPNRAGETTFAREFLPYYADCKQFINADLIAQGMSPSSPDAAAFRAGRLMLEEVERYAGLKETFGFETTLSGLGHLRLLRRLRKSGYEVHFFFLWANRFSCIDPSQRSSPSRGTQRAGDYRAKAIRAFHS